MNDRLIGELVTALKEERQRQLEALGDMPKSDPFDHGVQVGDYRGICRALDVLNGVLDDNLTREASL
jgi:hypothetical protein